MRRFLLAMMAVGCVSCADPSGVDLVPAFLIDPKGDTAVVELPSTAQVGHAFSVIIHPYLSGCGEFAITQTEADITGLGADVYPQMTSPHGASTCQDGGSENNVAELSFGQPGIAIVRILGRRINSNAVVVTRHVVIVQ